MKSHATIKNELQNYYQEKKNQPDDFAKMGWKSLYAQNVRFLQFTRSFTLENNDIINDLGCGIGNLYVFLENNYSSINFKYLGYDMIEDMIVDARNKFGKNPNAAFFTIDNTLEIQAADYTFASGIFNLKFTVSAEEWLQYILETIKTMFSKSRKGISFNCLTSYSDKEYMRDELYYPDPLFIFDFCKKELSKNIALYHDYNEYDFTISVSK